jgi:hypothetical protein
MMTTFFLTVVSANPQAVQLVCNRQNLKNMASKPQSLSHGARDDYQTIELCLQSSVSGPLPSERRGSAGLTGIRITVVITMLPQVVIVPGHVVDEDVFHTYSTYVAGWSQKPTYG